MAIKILSLLIWIVLIGFHIIRVESLESGMVFRIMLFTGEMGQMIKQGAKKHSVIIICENM